MDSPTEGVSNKPMRLKILYTFDAEGKNICLARWPKVLSIQTAFIDDITEIGVVDLKLCLTAVNNSSPEIFSDDSRDYTVYAFDYSEEGTPLSGQGMLSTIFEEPREPVDDEQPLKYVTGRITKSVLGFLPGVNGQESLEVKLRLLPVLKRSRPLPSPSIDLNFDSQSWSNPQQNPALRQSLSHGSPIDTTGLDSVQRMLHEGSTPRELSADSPTDYFLAQSRPSSRPGSPGQAPPNFPIQRATGQPSRTLSGVSTPVLPQQHSKKRSESFNISFDNGEDMQDDGPQRKRAKITQIGALRRSDLNIERQPESLRMAASSASSVRGHRPNILNLAINNLKGGLEEPVRPPTPIPDIRSLPLKRTMSESNTLRRGSLASLHMPVAQPGPQQPDPSIFSAASPEFRQDSVGSTPLNIPSSPPVMGHFGSAASSPFPVHAQFDDSGFYSEEGGQNWDCLDFDSFANPNPSPNSNANPPDGNALQGPTNMEAESRIDLQSQANPSHQTGTHSQQSAPEVALPPPPRPPSRPATATAKLPRSRARANKAPVRPTMSSPKLAPAPYPMNRPMEHPGMAMQSVSLPPPNSGAPPNSHPPVQPPAYAHPLPPAPPAHSALPPSLSALPAPPVAASDPAAPTFQRANTWAGDIMSDLLTSDAPIGEEPAGKRERKKKVGREKMMARLENAIARNEMPPYCHNCGTIDTPAWRTVVAQTLPGSLYESFQVFPNTDGFVWKEITEEEDGVVKTFRAIKIHKTADDNGDDLVNVNLCNPCGIWFRKKNEMRPEDKWVKGPKDPKEKKKRPARTRSRRVAAKNGQESDMRSDAPDPGSEGSSPADGATEDDLAGEGDRGEADSPDPLTEQPTNGPITTRLSSSHSSGDTGRPNTASGTDPVQAPAVAVLDPSLRVRDGAATAPNADGPHGLNMTPPPLRRQLFPSPNQKSVSPRSKTASTQGNGAMPLSEVTNGCRRSPRHQKTSPIASARQTSPVIGDKENAYPVSPLDELDHLFHDDGTLPALPQTPTPVRRSGRIIFKTPNKTPSKQPTTSPSRILTSATKVGSVTRSTTGEQTPASRAVEEGMRDWLQANELSGFGDPTGLAFGFSQGASSDFDWPELPSLNVHTPARGRMAGAMNHADSDVFDATMPSGMMNTPELHRLMTDDFVDHGMRGYEANKTLALNEGSSTKENALGVDGMGGLRRSPRKHRSP